MIAPEIQIFFKELCCFWAGMDEFAFSSKFREHGDS